MNTYTFHSETDVKFESDVKFSNELVFLRFCKFYHKHVAIEFAGCLVRRSSVVYKCCVFLLADIVDKPVSKVSAGKVLSHGSLELNPRLHGHNTSLHIHPRHWNIDFPQKP